jgi:hypothetical protein
MPMPEQFKYDVRVRERLQRKRLVTESEVERHLETLQDVSANAVDIELKQPALLSEAERAENSVIVRPAPPRPVQVAAPISLEDEEEEEEEELPRKPTKPQLAAAPVAALPVAAAPAAALPAAAAPAAALPAGEDEDDEDDDEEADDDEDDDDEDDDDDDAEEEEGEEKDETGGGGGDVE